MDFFKVRSVEEATEIVKSHLTKTCRTEWVTLTESLGRYLAEDIHSSETVPDFNKSTVDGYAVVASDTFGASETIPVVLTGIGEVLMGCAPDFSIERGQCAYVPTGGVVPQGADAVVMIEYSEEMAGDIFIERSSSVGENLIYRGEDISQGDLLAKRGCRITPQTIGALAAAGVSRLPVVLSHCFSIISTGDEIASTDDVITQGQVRDINSFTIGAAVTELGGRVISSSVVRDDLETLKSQIERDLMESDILLLSGGSSVGTRDFTLKAIEELGGELLIHGIAMKPGKPTIIATIGEKLIIGLPGHPVSALMVFRALFQEPMMGEVHPYTMTLTKSIHSTPGRTTYQPVKVAGDEATPFYGKSGVISLLSEAFGYMVIPSHKEGFSAGETVKIYKF